MSEERITIVIDGDNSGGIEAIQGIVDQLNQASNSANMASGNFDQITIALGETSKASGDAGRNMQRAFNPIRVMSRDVWALAYAFRRLNYTVFGNNEAIGKMVDVMVALGSVLRILWVIQSVNEMLNTMKLSVASLTILHTIWDKVLMSNAFWLGVISGGALLAAGALAFTAVASSAPKGYASGGTIPETGTYYLHKGETVSPSNGPDYSQINITLNTGPINGVGDMEDAMIGLSRRVAMEKRRRGIS